MLPATGILVEDQDCAPYQVLQEKNMFMLKAYKKCFLKRGEEIMCYRINKMVQDIDWIR